MRTEEIRTEELLAIGATKLATSHRLCDLGRTLRARTEWNLASARIVRRRQPWISGGVDPPDQETRYRIRSLLDSWGIHRNHGLTLWAGKSLGGHRCAACDRDIPTGEVEYELVLAEAVSFLFHRACFDAWSA